MTVPDEEPERELNNIELENEIACLKTQIKGLRLEFERLDGVVNSLHNDVVRLQGQKRDG